MRKVRLNTKLILFTLASLVFVMAVSTCVVTFITTRQNRAGSYDRLRKSLDIVRDDLLTKQAKLLADALQMASVNGMGSRVKFLFDYKTNPDETMTGNTYKEIIHDTLQIGITSKLWKTLVYDAEGDLIAFVSQNDEESMLCGYVVGNPNRTFRHASVKKGVELKTDLWKKGETLPDPTLQLKYQGRIPNQERMSFEAWGPFICLVAYAPIMGNEYNQKTSTLEKRQAGFAQAVLRLDKAFVQKMSTLTGMGINLFKGQKLAIGSVPEYDTLQVPKGAESQGTRELAKQEVLVSDIDVKKEGYYQGILPLRGHAQDLGSVAALYSKKFAQDNTRHMLQLLCLVGLGCLVLILPFCILFANTLTRPIDRAIHSLTDSAQEISSASGQVSSTSQMLAEGASEQAASIEETSSSMEEMASMTRQTADHAQQADLSSKQAKENLHTANKSMKALILSMTDASAAGSNVAKIIKTIDEIAFQTNLLALNAAVEAARAGQAGAGFAVVADEVRRLALRSAEASRNTQEMVKDIIEKINRGSDLVKETDGRYREAAISVQQVTELLASISVASEQQARGIDQINRAVAEMDRVTQQNAAGAEESAAASQRLNHQSSEMQGIVDQLLSIVGGSTMTKGVAGARAEEPHHSHTASPKPPGEPPAALPATEPVRALAEGSNQRARGSGPSD